MSHVDIFVDPGQNPPYVGGRFALYRRTLDMFYYATVVRIFTTRENGDGTISYPIDAQCRLMNENDQALCTVPVYDHERRTWQEMGQLLESKPVEEAVVAL
jgi:hypothetical protein